MPLRLPTNLACWVDTPDGSSSSSSSKVVQGVWDILGEGLAVVPPDLIAQLRAAYDGCSVDDFGDAWSTGAESGLFPAFCRAGGPAAPGMDAFLAQGRLRIRRRRLGGKAVGVRGASRLFWVSHGDKGGRCVCSVLCQVLTCSSSSLSWEGEVCATWVLSHSG